MTRLSPIIRSGIIVLLLAAARTAPAAAPGAEAGPASFLALGDSYTIGQGVSPESRWPEQLAAALNASGFPVSPPRVIARTGWTTRDLAGALERARLNGPYDLVTLMIGVNDQYQGRHISFYRSDLDELLRTALELAGGDDRKVILISIPDWGRSPFAEGRDRRKISEDINRFNQEGRAAARHFGVRYVDVTPQSRDAEGNRAMFAHDGLHPSAAAHTAWTALIAPEAAEALRNFTAP